MEIPIDAAGRTWTITVSVTAKPASQQRWCEVSGT